jgi:hypothetical protein
MTGIDNILSEAVRSDNIEDIRKRDPAEVLKMSLENIVDILDCHKKAIDKLLQLLADNERIRSDLEERVDTLERRVSLLLEGL